MAERERKSQKLRTRRALLEAARGLLSDGDPVTVIAAAERAGVSKATAYRYFSDPAVLAAEAGLDISVLSYQEVVAGAEGLRARLRAISLYFLDLAIDHEAEFRNFLGLSLMAWRPDGESQAQRGGRRLPMFEAALKEAEPGLDEANRVRMVRALSLATGVEAMIALYDVVGTDRDAARGAVLDVADAIIDKYLPGA